jgi:hypothetical protein
MTVFPEIFWNSHEIIVICKQESAREGELIEAIYDTPTIIVTGPSKHSRLMRYLFEGMTWDAGAFSSKKGKCGVRGR